MTTIPLINIAALRSENTAERWAVVQSIATAFRDIGFMAVQGHNIPEQVISAMREQTRLLFKRPMDEKLALTVHPTNYRGYIPLGFFTPNGGGGAATLSPTLTLTLKMLPASGALTGSPEAACAAGAAAAAAEGADDGADAQHNRASSSPSPARPPPAPPSPSCSGASPRSRPQGAPRPPGCAPRRSAPCEDR